MYSRPYFSFWIIQVIRSGLLGTMSEQDKKLQEVNQLLLFLLAWHN